MTTSKPILVVAGVGNASGEQILTQPHPLTPAEIYAAQELVEPLRAYDFPPHFESHSRHSKMIFTVNLTYI